MEAGASICYFITLEFVAAFMSVFVFWSTWTARYKNQRSLAGTCE